MLNEDEIDAVMRTNAALTKRVAELELEVAVLTDNLNLSRRVSDNLQSQLEAKGKRVAELERCMQEVGLLAFMRDATPGDITAHMTRVMDSYVQRIAEIQSQLAWTPVSKGLPTEPGVYEFYDVNERYMLGVYELTPGGRWLSFDGDPWAVVEFEFYTTHYRRIELPKDGES